MVHHHNDTTRECSTEQQKTHTSNAQTHELLTQLAPDRRADMQRIAQTQARPSDCGSLPGLAVEAEKAKTAAKAKTGDPREGHAETSTGNGGDRRQSPANGRRDDATRAAAANNEVISQAVRRALAAGTAEPVARAAAEAAVRAAGPEAAVVAQAQAVVRATADGAVRAESATTLLRGDKTAPAQNLENAGAHHTEHADSTHGDHADHAADHAADRTLAVRSTDAASGERNTIDSAKVGRAGSSPDLIAPLAQSGDMVQAAMHAANNGLVRPEADTIATAKDVSHVGRSLGSSGSDSVQALPHAVDRNTESHAGDVVNRVANDLRGMKGTDGIAPNVVAASDSIRVHSGQGGQIAESLRNPGAEVVAVSNHQTLRSDLAGMAGVKGNETAVVLSNHTAMLDSGSGGSAAGFVRAKDYIQPLPSLESGGGSLAAAARVRDFSTAPADVASAPVVGKVREVAAVAALEAPMSTPAIAAALRPREGEAVAQFERTLTALTLPLRIELSHDTVLSLIKQTQIVPPTEMPRERAAIAAAPSAVAPSVVAEALPRTTEPVRVVEPVRAVEPTTRLAAATTSDEVPRRIVPQSAEEPRRAIAAEEPRRPIPPEEPARVIALNEIHITLPAGAHAPVMQDPILTGEIVRSSHQLTAALITAAEHISEPRPIAQPATTERVAEPQRTTETAYRAPVEQPQQQQHQPLPEVQHQRPVYVEGTTPPSDTTQVVAQSMSFRPSAQRALTGAEIALGVVLVAGAISKTRSSENEQQQIGNAPTSARYVDATQLQDAARLTGAAPYTDNTRAIGASRLTDASPVTGVTRVNTFPGFAGLSQVSETADVIKDAPAMPTQQEYLNMAKAVAHSTTRASWSITPGETLAYLAERFYNDAKVAYLIAEINRHTTTQTTMDGKLIVQLQSRQTIQLPNADDLELFRGRDLKDLRIENLVTIVTEREFDRQLVNMVMSRPMGVPALQPQPVVAHSAAAARLPLKYKVQF